MLETIRFNIARLESLSKEVAPILPGCRAWAVIYPFPAIGPEGGRQGIRIRVRVVDIPTEELDLRGGDLDGDERFIVDRINVVLSSPEEVRDALATAGVDCEGFDVLPFRTGLPF